MHPTLQQRINQQQHLSQLRDSLLHLHRILLETERRAYEQRHGKVSRGELLQLVISDSQFDWLHQLSKRVVQIDELRQADEPLTAEILLAVTADLQALLTPAATGAFALKYDAAMQQSPDVVLAHAGVMVLLAE